MNFSNIKIGPRIALGFAVMLVILVGMTIFGISRLSAITERMEDIVKVQYRKVLEVNSIQDEVNVIARSLRNTLIFSDSDMIEKELARIAKSRQIIVENLEKLHKQITTDEGKALLAKVEETRAKLVASQDMFIKALKSGMLDEAKALLMDPLRPQQLAYMEAIEKLIEYQSALMDKSYTSAIETYETAKMAFMLISALAALMVVAIAWVITRSITRPISEAVQLAETVANGDLTKQIRATSNDEVGTLLKALSRMNANLVRIVAEVRTSSDSISTGSSEIASGNMDLSSRTEQQASSLEETASSMEELTSTVKQNADNARQANQLAVSASGVAVKGGTVVSQVVETMQSITESSKKIADIISVIDGIAFQTNILALNAAVEAARAGEQGRGFAVVASEVRNLAQRSAAAAKEIKTLIDDSVEKVDAGSKLVGEAGSTMNEIVNSVRSVTDVMAEIMAASQEQSAGIEQVNQAIGQMDQVTQQNAALVEEAAAAAASLQDQAGNLAQAVSVFKLDSSDTGVAKQSTQPAKARAQATTKPVATRSRPTLSQAPAARQLATKATPNAGEWEEF